MMKGMQTVFEAAGGIDGLRRLAAAWHCRVMADEVVGHAFSHGFHPQHVERLAAYWAEALGGPTAYSGSDGDETSVVKMHSGNGEHDEMDRRGLPASIRLWPMSALRTTSLCVKRADYFAWATTTTMARYQQSADDVPTASASHAGHGTVSSRKTPQFPQHSGIGPTSICSASFWSARWLHAPRFALFAGDRPSMFDGWDVYWLSATPWQRRPSARRFSGESNSDARQFVSHSTPKWQAQEPSPVGGLVRSRSPE